jgi:hypothetical protein
MTLKVVEVDSIPADNTLSLALTPADQQALEDYEQIIENGLKSFVEVGRALSAIRDGKLYRQTHKTFEAYCRERWGLGRSYANRQIAAASVIENLVTIGTKNQSAMTALPANESQVRPLIDLTPDDQRLVWQQVITSAPNGRITAKHIKGIVEQHKPTIQKKRPSRHVETACQQCEVYRNRIIELESQLNNQLTIDARIRYILPGKDCTTPELVKAINDAYPDNPTKATRENVSVALSRLYKEGVVNKRGNVYRMGD